MNQKKIWIPISTGIISASTGGGIVYAITSNNQTQKVIENEKEIIALKEIIRDLKESLNELKIIVQILLGRGKNGNN